MFLINKISFCNVIDFAAEEMLKYLRMMMPECGRIDIKYDTDAKKGFRLGLMSDFGLDTSDAEDLFYDDIIYIDTNENGGIIAGDNPRSILLAVYEFFRQNGCRWLFSGVDGEFIPMRDIKPVKFRYKPSCRCRSYCYEGAVIQQSMLDIIDISPKLGLNTYMMEQRETWHYDHFYKHLGNTENRAAEPISFETRVQWKRAVEAEIEKRGLMYHNVGHGWTSEPFVNDPEYMNYIALVNGKRELQRGVPVYTNVCMSNPVVREKICASAVDYAKHHENTDLLHVWLADLSNNHCECAECVKKTPSDWYVVLLNEMDKALEEAGLATRIVFIAYVDTMWAPLTEKFNNPKRFSLLFAPISRNYTSTLPPLSPDFKLTPYVRNKNTLPKTLTENIEYLKEWYKIFDGMVVAFEYHFWRVSYLEPTGIALAKCIYDDVKAYKANGIDGMIEDGTVRPFFPTGLAFYTCARAMYDTSLSFEEIAEDYFSHAFGADWKKFYDILSELCDLFDPEYLAGIKSVDTEISGYYNPAHAKDLEKIPALMEKLRVLIKENYTSEHRAQTVAVRILEHYTDYCVLLADALVSKANGREEEAEKKYKAMFVEFGKREVEIQQYFDHFMAVYALADLFKPYSKSTKPVIVQQV